MQRASTKVSGASPGEQSEESGTKKKTQPRQTAMNTRCRLALQQSHTVLMKDIDVKRTTDALFSRMVLTLEDKQKIQEMPNENEKRTTLLDILPKRSQGAYDELCECLASDQPWLKDVIKAKHDNITDDDLVFFEEQKRDQRAESTTEIVGILRENLKERMNQWKTALEQGFPDQEGLLPYIDQPYCLELEPSQEQSDENVGRGRARIGKPESGSSEERIDASRSINLIEESTPGKRITFFGGAGTGKTTLLKEIARSWINRSNPILVEKFTFMFLIPLRFVGKTSLLNTICDELKLFPTNNAGELDKSVHRNEKKTLFLLDSFEELRLDVIQEEISEIGDLITGRLFPRSTVVVTSRPVYKLRKLGHQKIAQLKDLPEDRVKEVILEHLGEDQSAVDDVLQSFPAVAYLQKPINLALFLFIIRKYKHLTHSRTQADLFSLMLQYFMLACAKKKKLPEFNPQSGSFLANRNIHKDIRRLFSDLAKKCYDERREINGVLHVEDPDDLAEYLRFGLFTKGSESDTVVLPHPLFQEFFGAAHLAENPQTWTGILDDIREKSESRSPRPSLIDIVRPMGLENIVRFAVALSPRVCGELASLFVIEREQIEGCENYRLVNFEYYAELVRDCSSENGKRVLAAALLKAPVVDVSDIYRNTQGRASLLLSSHVIDSLDYSECVTFLKKVHNLAMCKTDGKFFVSCTGDCKTLEIRDSFPVALVHKYDCHIHTDQLILRGDDDCDLDVPSSMFPIKVSTVRLLKLVCCTLHAKMPEINMSVACPGSSSPVTHSSLLETVYLNRVQGHQPCGVITSRPCHLEMIFCHNVRVCTLGTCFPELSDLKVEFGTIVADTEEERMSWLSNVPSVRALGLAHIEGESPSVSHQLNIWTKRQELKYLYLSNYTLLSTDRTVRINETLEELELGNCQSDVDFVQLFEVCSHCLQLLKLTVFESRLLFRVRDASDTCIQNHTLGELLLLRCTGEVDLGKVFDACSHCMQLTKLIIEECQLVDTVRDTSATCSQNNVHRTRSQNTTLRELCLLFFKEKVDLRKVLDACGQSSQLTKLTVAKCQLAVRIRDASHLYMQNNTLNELLLTECKGDVDLGEVFDACRQCPQLSELTVDQCQLVVRVRDASHTYMPNNTLGELYLLLCKGEVELGEVFDACRQCSQLTKLTVDQCQLAVRVRDVSDTYTQNNTLSELYLFLCKSEVDLGEVFDACRQCSQLTQLTVDQCQLAVRVRDASDTYMQNNTLSKLWLTECKGDVDLGEVFDACGQCSQLTKLTVDQCQLAVRVRDASDTYTQNNTLRKLCLLLCKGEVDLGEVFDACRQCSQLTKLTVDQCQIAVRVRDASDPATQNNTLTELYLLLCKGDVDLGEVFDVCGQCSQLTELTVEQCQLAVRARGVSDTYTLNITLRELYLLLCKGDVDLGEVFDACRQCSQLTELTVDQCQIAVRARDASDPATQNNTLTELYLVLCKGDVDLGEVFDACRQCSQLTKLTVDQCQLAVRARHASDTYTQNNILRELYLLLCKGEVELGEVFDACRQCLQLTELTVDRCQIAVRARDASDTYTQNNTLNELQLLECTGDIYLGMLFEACNQCLQLTSLAVGRCQLRVGYIDNTAKQNNTLSELRLAECKGDVVLDKIFEVGSHCLQLRTVLVSQSHVVLDAEKIQSFKQMPRLQSLELDQSSVHTPSGQRLSSEEVNKTLHRLCPSIQLLGLDSGPDEPETGAFGRLDSAEAGPETAVSADMASSDPSTRPRRKGPLAFLRRLFKK